MKKALKILVLLTTSLVYSQNNSQSEVFKKIIEEQINKGSLNLYVQCEKPQTFFDKTIFKEETGLEVSEKILNEIEVNIEKSSASFWNSKLTTELNYDSNFLNGKKCLTRKDTEKLFLKTKKRQNIISISEPIFDYTYENCIVSITYHTYIDSAAGHSYFLKKIHGIWTIITIYNFWMT